MHKFLELIYKGYSVDPVQKMMEKLDETNQAKLMAMMLGYEAQWLEKDNREIVPYAVELPFNVPLIHPDTGKPIPRARMKGAIDLVYSHNGKMLIQEHKTTSESLAVDSNYWKTIVLSPQAGLYYMVANQMDWDVEGIVYNVIRTPQIRRKKDEDVDSYMERIADDMIGNQESYFKRMQYNFTPEQVEEFQKDLVECWEIMEYGKRRGIAPRYTNNCKQGYFVCEYFDLCSGQSSVDGRKYYKGGYSKPGARNIGTVRGHLKVIRGGRTD